jgi:diguanylate cyclase (GGDEF)-like protein
MRVKLLREWLKARERVCAAIVGPHALAFMPAALLAAYWAGGEAALIITAIAIPGTFLALGGLSFDHRRLFLPRDSFTGLLQRDGFEDLVEHTFEKTANGNRSSAVFHIELDDFAQLIERHGEAAADIVIQRSGDRIASTLRDIDNVARLGDCRFALCLGATRHMDLEVCIQLAGRIQNIIEEPISVDGVSVYMTATIGFCLRSRAP